jgi:hypothetical protein
VLLINLNKNLKIYFHIIGNHSYDICHTPNRDKQSIQKIAFSDVKNEVKYISIWLIGFRIPLLCLSKSQHLKLLMPRFILFLS